MPLKVSLHKKVSKFLDKLSADDKNRCIDAILRLSEDPFTARSGVDIKKLKGLRFTLYRLRVGAFRFEYFVAEDTIWVVDAFQRERGY